MTVEDEHADVLIRVHNRGPGISRDDRAHIFDRFYRGANTQDIAGSGLGLSIAMRAAEQNAGTLILERAEPDNTIFALRFPHKND